MSELPKWQPTRPINLLEVGPYEALAMLYNDERARADYWEARARLAVEALEKYDRNMPIAKLAAHTLAAIGDLPKSSEKEREHG